MRILVLCHHYPPEIGAAAKRISGFVRSWRAAGADVDVVTSLPHYPSGSWDRSVPMSTLGRPQRGEAGETIRRVPFLPDSQSGGTKLADQIVVAASSGLRGLSGPYDVVFASVPALPTLGPATALANLHRVPLVLEFRDAWPDLVAESDVAPTPALQEKVTNLITAAQRRADAIITTSHGFADVLQRRLEDADDAGESTRSSRRVVAIRNGVDVDAVPLSPPLAPFVTPLRVLYLGTLGVSQDLDVAVRALAEIGADRVEARFIGDGSAKAGLQALAEELGAPIRFEDPISADGVWDAYRWSHTCLVPLRDWPSFAYTIPSKVFETMATGRHITAAITGEAATIVRDAGGGVVVEPGSVAALVDALSDLIENPSKLVMGEGPREWVATEANRERSARLALDVLDDVVEAHRRSDAVGIGDRSRRSLNMARNVGLGPMAARLRSRAGRTLESRGVVHTVAAVDPTDLGDAAGWPRTFAPLGSAGPMTGQVAEDVAKGVFAFRGERHELDVPIEWQTSEPSHLWRFDLHGFEWIDAFVDHPDGEWAGGAFADLIESWISANPVGAGDGWSTFPASTRAWAWCCAMGDLIPEGTTRTAVANSLAEHQRFIEAHLELDLGGNHLIKNLKALVGLGVFFDDPVRAENALRELERELQVQVLADGAHAERATAYHADVLADLIDIHGLAGAAGIPMPFDLAEVIARMRDHLGAVATPNGTLATIGDGWSVSEHRVRDLGPSGSRSRLDIRRDAGLVVARPGTRMHAVLSVGETGWKRLPGHAHSSALSMVIIDGDQPVLTDLGSSTYAAGPVRTFERGCHSHSTLSINGVDQAEHWGAFRAGRLASGRLVSAHDDPAGDVCVAAECDWSRGGVDARHGRSWMISDDRVIVEDDVVGRGVDSVELNFCIAHDLAEIERLWSEDENADDENSAIFGFGSWKLELDLPPASRLRLVPALGGQPATVLRAHVRVDGDRVSLRSTLSRMKGTLDHG